MNPNTIVKFFGACIIIIFGFFIWLVFHHYWQGIQGAVNTTTWVGIAPDIVPMLGIAAFLACVYGAYLKLSSIGKPKIPRQPRYPEQTGLRRFIMKDRSGDEFDE